MERYEGEKRVKNIHIIVATGVWGQDQLRYRRHRLAGFLKNDPGTQEVIWLCPAPRRQGPVHSNLASGISQWTVQDWLPQKMFRFGRYVDAFYKRKLHPVLSHIQPLSGQYRFYLWYTFPGFPVLADLFPWTRVIYDCSDLWTSPIGGRQSLVTLFRQLVVAKAEQRIISKADPIFCTSDYLRDQVIKKVEAGTKQSVFTFENGVEFDLFSGKIRAENVLPENFKGTVLGYVGGIKPKLDFRLIQQVAEKKRQWLFLLVGPDGTGSSGEFQQLLNEENILWIGSVPPADVPRYMNLIDIGIMPYKPSPYNEAVFPLKLFEFLAAGKPAVGVHLPSTKKYAEEAVYVPLDSGDPELLIRACERLADVKNQETARNRRIELAKTKNWHQIFQKMWDLVLKA